MNTVKRGRGRPPGTGLNDHPALTRIADALLQTPRMKPTTAMHRVLDKPDATTVRRLQGKWKAKGSLYLAEAKARRAAAQEAEQRSLEATMCRRLAEAARPPFGGVGTVSRGAELALRHSTVSKAMQEVFDSPMMRALREFHDTPAMRAMREFHDSPAMRAIQKLQNSPAMRAAQEAMNSPAMRRLEEQMERARIVSERLQLPKPYS